MSDRYLVLPQRGIPIYPTAADLPTTAPQGSFAVTADTGQLYEFFAGTWDLVLTPSGVPAPGGPQGSVQYNNAGAFAGFGNWDGTLLTVPGNLLATQYSVPDSTFNAGVVIDHAGNADFTSLTLQNPYNPFNQSLNTTDMVTFDTVNAGAGIFGSIGVGTASIDNSGNANFNSISINDDELVDPSKNITANSLIINSTPSISSSNDGTFNHVDSLTGYSVSGSPSIDSFNDFVGNAIIFPTGGVIDGVSSNVIRFNAGAASIDVSGNLKANSGDFQSAGSLYGAGIPLLIGNNSGMGSDPGANEMIFSNSDPFAGRSFFNNDQPSGRQEFIISNSGQGNWTSNFISFAAVGSGGSSYFGMPNGSPWIVAQDNSGAVQQAFGIGSQGAIPFYLASNGLWHAVVFPSGNVGIGNGIVDDGITAFQVKGDGTNSAKFLSGSVYINSNSSDGTGSLLQVVGNGSTAASFQSGAVIMGSTTWDNTSALQVTGNIHATTYSNDAGYLVDSSGNTQVNNLKVAGLNPNLVVVTDGSNNLVSSTTTDVELGYVSGVTSSVQTQLNHIFVTMTQNNTATATFNTTSNNETIYDTSSTLAASLTINLPGTSVAGQILRYVSNRVVTTVTVNGTVSVGAALTTLAANSSVAWQAIDASGTFIRIQ